MTRLMDEPFGLDDPTYQMWLTSEEWALLFTMWLTTELRREAEPVGYVLGTRRELVKLIRDHHYQPEGVRLDEDDNVYRTSPTPTHPETGQWLSQVAMGNWPDLSVCFRVAIEFCDEHGLEALKERLRRLLADAMDNRTAFIAQRSPEIEQRYKDILDEIISHEARQEVN